MTPLVLWIVTLAAAYLLGSIPTGYLLVLVFRDQDVRSTGSGNIGATNVARSGSKGLAIATLLLDVLKGILAVVFAQHMAQWAGYPNGYALAGVAGVVAVAAHIFPVWLGFRGGKGVATGLGAFLAMMPFVSLVAVLIFALVVALTRFVSLASIVASASLAAMAVIFDSRRVLIVDLCYIAIALLVIAKHHGNIARLRAHTEPRFGKPGSTLST